MASLKEIRSRIASVNSTLKITSAMKMVASAKLHRVQSNAEALTEYEKHLSLMASVLVRRLGDSVVSPLTLPHKTERHAAVVAIASNGSLCGAFNANAVHKTLETCAGCGSVKVIPVGRKMAEAMKKCGYDAEDDAERLRRGAKSESDLLVQRFVFLREAGEYYMKKSSIMFGLRGFVELHFLPVRGEIPKAVEDVGYLVHAAMRKLGRLGAARVC